MKEKMKSLKKWNFRKLILCIIVIHSCLTIQAQKFTLNDFVYRVLSTKENTVALVEALNKRGDVTIPDQVEYNWVKYTVTEIRGAFRNNFVSLTSIHIPSSVTSIGREAFWNCRGLKTIFIPNSVKVIGESAFASCTGLISIDLPDSLTLIGINAFSGCHSLTKIVIPNSVSEIGSGAFEYCTNLVSVIMPMPESLSSIGYNIFSGCTSLISDPVYKSYALINEKMNWDLICDSDNLTEFCSFIKNFPKSEYIVIAQKRIDEIESIKQADIVISYPANVKSGYTPINGVNQISWSWDISFKEKNNKSGFYLSSSSYIIKKDNQVFYPKSGQGYRRIAVKKGYSDVATMTLYGAELRGGIFSCTWIGQDDWGNGIEVVETVELQ